MNIKSKKKFFIALWQFLFFSSISIFLTFIYVNQAWKKINVEQIKITGFSGISENQIKKTAGIFFPRNLLELNPKEIEAYLKQKLPIKGISVNRHFFPPHIHLNLVEKEPVAFASRTLLNKVENGTIDIHGDWIPLEFISESKKNKINLFIDEWSPSKKKEITSIIKNAYKIKGGLQKIKISPLQEISLETKDFNKVLIGSNTDRLLEQINKLNQLQKALPNLLINTKVKIVDLRDPGKPELKIEKILN